MVRLCGQLYHIKKKRLVKNIFADNSCMYRCITLPIIQAKHEFDQPVLWYKVSKAQESIVEWNVYSLLAAVKHKTYTTILIRMKFWMCSIDFLVPSEKWCYRDTKAGEHHLQVKNVNGSLSFLFELCNRPHRNRCLDEIPLATIPEIEMFWLIRACYWRSWLLISILIWIKIDTHPAIGLAIWNQFLIVAWFNRFCLEDDNITQYLRGVTSGVESPQHR